MHLSTYLHLHINFRQDPRVSVHVTKDLIEWELEITSVVEEDEGEYECQVNTNPLSQLMSRLRVTRKTNE